MSKFPNVFILGTLLVALMLIYALVSGLKPQEKFKEQTVESTYIPKDKLIVYQGSTLPDKPPNAVIFDNDVNLPTIDGKPNSMHSMFLFAANKCSPECCSYSPFSCDRGCVCMTEDQIKFVSSRGNNSAGTKCYGQSEY